MQLYKHQKYIQYAKMVQTKHLKVSPFYYGYLNKTQDDNLAFNFKSSRIPKRNFEPLIRKHLYPDLTFLQQQYLQGKLRELQKNLYSNTANCESAYKYVKELNRLGMYSDVRQVHQSIILPNSFQYRTVDPYNYNKLLTQLNYSTNKLKQRPNLNHIQTFGQNQNNNSGNSKIFGKLFYLGALGGMAYYFISEAQIQIKTKEELENDLKSLFQNDSLKSKFNLDKEQSRLKLKTNILKNKKEEKKTTFKDVVGINEYKEELEDVVDFLKNPDKYIESGAKLPRGILLVGPPGTGKTLLARAVAGEANCNFYYKSGAEFDEQYVGVGAARVRDLFKQARDNAPSIIFLDEIDSLGGQRKSSDPSHSRDTINQILTEMDGFQQQDNIIVIAATNFEQEQKQIQSLDQALKRPGRFDKIINVPLPDMIGRKEIFQYYMTKIRTHENVEAAFLARQTSGFSGADIQNMVNIAILNAIKNQRKIAEQQDFEFAFDRISMGVGRKSLAVSEKDKLVTAYHEGGHALTSLLTQGATPLHKVTILPRGSALGFTAMVPQSESDNVSMTKKKIIAQIDVAMGGRAAEELYMGKDEISSGCSSDLAKATELGYLYVKQLGMQNSLISGNVRTSDRYDYEIDQEVKQLLKQSYERVMKLLKKNESKLNSLAKELVKQETMDQSEIKSLLNLK